MWKLYPVQNRIEITAMHSFFEFRRPDGYSFPGESHNFWECVYVQEGAVFVSGDERVYPMKRGSLIFHKPLELHKFTVDCADGAVLLVFSFSMRGELTDFFKNKLFLLSQTQEELLKRCLSFVRKHDPHTAHRPTSALEPCKSLPTFSQRLSLQLTELLLELYENSEPAAPASAPDAALFAKAVGYMNGNLNREPDVAQIARYCNVSETGLKRIFKKFSGQAVHRYYTMLRLNAAKELLGEGVPIGKIAEKLGFSSAGYFSYAFKRETGMSPNCWKRETAAYEGALRDRSCSDFCGDTAQEQDVAEKSGFSVDKDGTL